MTYRSEELLCRAFAEHARRRGWTVYPEQGNWDLLLTKDGLQVGVQAKLRTTLEVFAQALPGLTDRTSPHFRAVLVDRLPLAGGKRSPTGLEWAERVARAARLGLITTQGDDAFYLTPNVLDVEVLRRDRVVGAYAWEGGRVWTPPYVPTNAAGVPAPRTVSPYKVAAVRLARVAVERGWVCLDDARDAVESVGGGMSARGLLTRYFDSTSEFVRAGSRQRRWVAKPRFSATSEFPDVAADLP